MIKFLFGKLGLYQIHTNHSIFVSNEGVCGPIITNFVDDLNIFALCNSGIILQIKKKLAAAFDMVDMEPFAFYIELKVARDQERRTIKLSQTEYIKKLLDCHGMLKAKRAKVPMQKTALLPLETPTSNFEEAKYSAKVGFIMYVTVET